MESQHSWLSESVLFAFCDDQAIWGCPIVTWVFRNLPGFSKVGAKPPPWGRSPQKPKVNIRGGWEMWAAGLVRGEKEGYLQERDFSKSKIDLPPT